MKIMFPVSAMERQLIKERPLEEWRPISWSRPHGFLRCEDSSGAVYHLHPEALGVLPIEAYSRGSCTHYVLKGVARLLQRQGRRAILRTLSTPAVIAACPESLTIRFFAYLCYAQPQPAEQERRQ